MSLRQPARQSPTLAVWLQLLNLANQVGATTAGSGFLAIDRRHAHTRTLTAPVRCLLVQRALESSRTGQGIESDLLMAPFFSLTTKETNLFLSSFNRLASSIQKEDSVGARVTKRGLRVARRSRGRTKHGRTTSEPIATEHCQTRPNAAIVDSRHANG